MAISAKEEKEARLPFLSPSLKPITKINLYELSPSLILSPPQSARATPHPFPSLLSICGQESSYQHRRRRRPFNLNVRTSAAFISLKENFPLDSHSHVRLLYTPLPPFAKTGPTHTHTEGEYQILHKALRGSA